MSDYSELLEKLVIALASSGRRMYVEDMIIDASALAHQTIAKQREHKLCEQNKQLEKKEQIGIS